MVGVSSPLGLFSALPHDPPIAVSCHLFSNQRYGGGTDIFSWIWAEAKCKTLDNFTENVCHGHIWAQQTYILVFFVWLVLIVWIPASIWEWTSAQCVHGLRGRSMVVKGIILAELCFMAYRPSSGLQAAQGKTISGHLLVVLCCVTNSTTCMCYENDTLNSPLSNLQEIRGVVHEQTFPNSSGSSCCPFLIIKRAYTPFSDTPLWAPSTVST